MINRTVLLNEVVDCYKSMGVNVSELHACNTLNDHDLVAFLSFLRKMKMNYFSKLLDDMIENV